VRSALSKAEARARAKQALKAQTTWPSDQVCEILAGLPDFQKAPRLALFTPRRWEVDLRTLWKCRPEGCVFPRVVAKDRMEFYPVDSLEDLKPGFGGILEPPPTNPVREWGENDLFLVPGLAFDTTMARVGSGAGYYDRYLEALKSRFYGVCWSSQLFTEPLHQERTDIRMGAVITEKGAIFRGQVPP
jgi:5-formyltetrahydrofolate cyclo-ligase